VVSPEDSLAAINLVVEANNSLENAMNTMLNAEPDSVQQMLDLMDFSEPFGLYSSAVAHDPGNPDANFGVAFTGFLMISQDQALQDMLLNWENYFNANEPFAVNETVARRGYGMPFTVDGIMIPIAPMVELPLSMAKMSLDYVPQFSEFQAIVAGSFLPVIQQSIAALEEVDDDPTYVFEVSPSMQGDAEADPIELDMTEIYLIEAGLYALDGLLNTVVAYNFDFVSHDAEGIMQELSQGSDFATLKSDGAQLLSGAYASAITAFDKVDMSLDFLEAETDEQSNDLIQILEIDDYDDIRAGLDDARSALQGPTTFHYSYWEDVYNNGNWVGEIEVEDSVDVDISQFFLNPIADFKALLPPYTMATAIEYDYEYFYLTQQIQAEDSNVTIEDLNNTYLEMNLDYYFMDGIPVLNASVRMGFLMFDLSTANPDDLPPSVFELYDEFVIMADAYSGALYQFPYLQFFWSGNVTTGQPLTISGNVHIEYEQQSSAYVTPDPTWNAETYTDWLASWPDPTMNNIFPNLDAAGLAELLNFHEEDWE